MAKKTNTTKKEYRSPQVPGQLYGYLIQVTRSVAHLLRAQPGQAVSVEYLDDVATEGDAVVVVEQDKSGLAHNPVSDRSVDLWKTLHNWVRAIRNGALKSDAKFVLYVAQNHHGSVIDRIHNVRSKPDADILVHNLRTEFLGEAPTYIARAALTDELREHVDGVLSASSEILALLFMNLTLENGSGSPNDDLLPLIAAKAIGEDARENVLKHLLGWADRTIKKCIEDRVPAVLKYDDFFNQLVGAARKFDRSEAVLPSSASDICQEDIENDLRDKTYVSQLVAVKLEEPEIVQAVKDFLRSAIDRTAWSEVGDVVEGSFRDFEDHLRRTWRNYKARVDIEVKHADEEERGRLLYANCTGLQLRLQGMDVPSHFVPGSYHALADSLDLGWHPRFRDVLAHAQRRAAAASEQSKTSLPPSPLEPSSSRVPLGLPAEEVPVASLSTPTKRVEDA